MYDQQQQRTNTVAALQRGLVDDGKPRDEDAEALRQQILRQGASYDTVRRLQINDDVFKTTDCEHCRRMQNDMRFVLIHILNVLEQIKTPVREIAATLNEQARAPVDEIEEEEEYGCFQLFRIRSI